MVTLFFALKIEGIPYWLSAYPIKAIPRFDDPELFFDDDDLFFDKKVRLLNNKDIISEEGSSVTLSQSINPDKDGSSSTTSLTFRIVDFRKFFKDYLTQRGLGDLLGKEVKVFLVRSTDAFPEESRPALFGYLEDISVQSGSVTVTVYNVLNYLRSNILPSWESELVENFEYDSLTLQGNRYIARSPGVYSISVQYTVAPGPVLASVTHISATIKRIDVTFPNGTQAKDVRRAVLDNADAERLVEVKSEDDNLIQVATVGAVSLIKTKFVKVQDTSGLTIGNSDLTFETFIMINNEVLKVISKDNSTNLIEIDELNRGLFKSFSGVTANVGDKVKSFYVLRGNPIDIFLKLSLSGQQNKSIPIKSYGFVSGIGPVTNAIELPSDDAYRDFGIVVGDKVTLNPLFSNRVVLAVEKIALLKSYIVVDGPDIGIDVNFSGNLQHRSMFDVLPIGAGVKSYLMDTQRFIDVRDLVAAELPDYEFYIKDDFNFKEFAEKELFFPAQLFLCPREGRISCAPLRPMAESGDVKTIDSSQFMRPEEMRINRSLNDLFYNAVSYYWDKDSVEDEFLSVRHSVDSDSALLYRKNLVPLVIESSGLRTNAQNLIFIEKKSKVTLDRYKAGALWFDAYMTLEHGIRYEIGDIVLFDGSDIYFPSFDSSDYTLGSAFYQVVNREVRSDGVRLTLVATQYRLDVRYTTFAPSSRIQSATGNELLVLPSYDFSGFESEKWRPYIGCRLKIINNDYTFTHSAVLDNVESPNSLFFQSTLPTIPIGCYLIPDDYHGNESFNRKIKVAHPSFGKKSIIQSVIGPDEFIVTSGDGAFFYEGLKIIIHDASWGVADESTVLSVTGDQVKLTAPVTITL
ncbi:MAG: hypothetical protein WHU54_09560, partial [Candidatus Bathyarchaeia archaeon]